MHLYQLSKQASSDFLLKRNLKTSNDVIICESYISRIPSSYI